MKLALVVAMVAGMVGCNVATNHADLRKAFEHHEALESTEERQDIDKVNQKFKATFNLDGFVTSERWKNYQRYAKTCPAIAEVTKVQIEKTMDGGNLVIRMIGPSNHMGKDGFETDVCSLWLVGGKENETLEVRDYSPY